MNILNIIMLTQNYTTCKVKGLWFDNDRSEESMYQHKLSKKEHIEHHMNYHPHSKNKVPNKIHKVKNTTISHGVNKNCAPNSIKSDIHPSNMCQNMFVVFTSILKSQGLFTESVSCPSKTKRKHCYVSEIHNWLSI